MASSTSGVWAVDIGSNALKAIHLVQGPEGPVVAGFDYVEHGRILSAGGIDDEVRQRVISETLHTFSGRNEIGKDEVAISVAGQNSFARFIKLPPVEKKRIPEIVQFEAVQQIPFDINEVEWDWQIMENPDSPDTEVGIFAIKNEIINAAMDHFNREDMKVACVQISPVALYNYAMYDMKNIGGFNERATIILDMGAENTTLVVCSRTGMWQRSIRIGGNTFTEAIADTFNLSFQKAEKLKRTAPMSKYMRQIFTAMKPVFTDLGSEIQRSLGFYSSSGAGREKGFARMVGFGGGMKLQGLAKYLQQTLNIPVVKPDSFERLALQSTVSAAKFHENVSDFGIVYGLGVQMLSEASIEVNLLPRKLARAMAWRRKSRMFTAAAGLLLVVSLLGLVRANIDRVQYKGNESVRSSVRATISEAQAAQSKLQEQQNRAAPLKQKVDKEMEKLKNRETVPSVNQMVMACLPNAENNPAQAALYEAFVNGDVTGVMAVPRHDRKQLFVTGLTVSYAADLSKATFDTARRSTATAIRPVRMSRESSDSSMYDQSRIMGRRGGAYDEVYGPGMPTMPGAPAPDTKGEEGPGFVVIVEGYSPYGAIGELLDPHGVGDDQSKWGFVTRLVNIGKIIRGGEFELYKKGDNKHFTLESGPVDLTDAKMPGGIGVEKEVERVRVEIDPLRRGLTGGLDRGRYDETSYGPGGMGSMGMGRPERIYVEQVLVDPMTNEEMSRVYDIITQDDVANDPTLGEKDLGRIRYDKLTNEPLYIRRDHWFRVSAKFRWKNAPQIPDPAAGAGNMYGPEGMMRGMY